MTSLTRLQMNMTSQSSLWMASLYMTSLHKNVTSQSTLLMGSLYITSLASHQFCITSQST